VKPLSLFVVLLLAAGLALVACDPSPRPESEGSTAGTETENVEVVEIVETGSDGQDAPSAVLLESKVEPVSPDSVPGSYRDPDVPEVTYNFNDDGSWEAIWQPQDETRGLMMSGVYLVEDGGLLHLRVLSFGRRESFLGDNWDRRAPPHPRPRAYFRMEGKQLVMTSNNSAQAFTMAPFTAARLVRVTD